MKKTLKYLLFFAAFLCLGLHGYAQENQGPPAPRANAQRAPGNGPPCDPGPSGENGKGSPPPPPGLCLPINDYLLPLFISGLLLGGFKLWKIEKNGPKPLEAENIKNDKNR